MTIEQRQAVYRQSIDCQDWSFRYFSLSVLSFFTAIILLFTRGVRFWAAADLISWSAYFIGYRYLNKSKALVIGLENQDD